MERIRERMVNAVGQRDDANIQVEQLQDALEASEAVRPPPLSRMMLGGRDSKRGALGVLSGCPPARRRLTARG